MTYFSGRNAHRNEKLGSREAEDQIKKHGELHGENYGLDQLVRLHQTGLYMIKYQLHLNFCFSNPDS